MSLRLVNFFIGGAIDSYGKDLGLFCGSADNNYTEVFANNCQFINGYDFQENGVPYIDVVDYANNILTDKAINRVLNHDSNTPFLMQYHTNVPHTPLTAEAELFSLCQGVDAGNGAYQPYYRQTICAMVSETNILLIMACILALYSKFKSCKCGLKTPILKFIDYVQ
jgi:hypothetical protein